MFNRGGGRDRVWQRPGGPELQRLPFLWCKSSHRGQFQATGLTSLKAQLGLVVRNQLWRASHEAGACWTVGDTVCPTPCTPGTQIVLAMVGSLGD